MGELFNIKRLVIPLIKGLPFIALVVLLSYLAAKRSVTYMVPMYETTSKVKLDDSNMGVNNTILYKDFDLFPTVNKIATEVEVIKSDAILSQVVKALDIKLNLNRKGKLKNTSYYQEAPISISYTLKDDDIIDKDINVLINSFDSVEVNYVLNHQPITKTGGFNESIQLDAINVRVKANKEWLSKSDSSDIYGHYFFAIESVNKSVANIKENIDIKSVDKDIPVIRISYKDPNPQRAADICNTIANIYINDYVNTKSEKALKTSSFINDRLENVKADLKNAEDELEYYKSQNKIINLKQETETGIKKIAELEVQLANLEMNEAALNRLEEFAINNDGTFEIDAPQIGFGDLLFTELMKKLKEYQITKNELLQIYTSKHEDVVTVQKSIDETIQYLLSGVTNARQDMSIKRASIQNKIAEANASFNNIPTLEKELFTLERNFQQYQKTYQLLQEKHTEASIASASTISFHRLLKKAPIPKIPIAPNKTLIYFISGFLGLLTSIALIYIWSFLTMKLRDENDIAMNSGLPLIGTVPKIFRSKSNITDATSNITFQLNELSNGKDCKLISLSSINKKTGKTFIAKALAETYAATGSNTLIVDANFRNPSLHKKFKVANEDGFSNYLSADHYCKTQITSTENLSLLTAGTKLNSPSILFNHIDFENRINDLKERYDVIIFDCPAFSHAPEAFNLLKLSTSGLIVGRKNKTPIKKLIEADVVQHNYNLNNIFWVLNGVRKKFFYNGINAKIKFSDSTIQSSESAAISGSKVQQAL